MTSAAKAALISLLNGTAEAVPLSKEAVLFSEEAMPLSKEAVSLSETVP